jgi:S1-C subfamily serine protease
VNFDPLPKMRGLVIGVAAVCLLALVLVGEPYPGIRSADAQATPTGDLPVAVRQVAASLRPAVVQITSQQLQVGQLNQPLEVPTGVGSGVICDSQGHILTNDHV